MGKYVDTSAVIQVIGGIYKNPKMIDETDKYTFYEEDFTEEFHRVIFGAIYNVYQLGSKEITVSIIEDYLQNYPKSYATYEAHKGAEWLEKISDIISLSTFDYYYNRMKKFTLLRMYNDVVGMDLKWLYDTDNIDNVKKKQAQEEWLDNTPLSEIAEIIDRKVTDIRMKYVDNNDEDFCQAGEGIKLLVESLQKHPEIGYPLFGSMFNSVVRGARLKKFYLRSAATGVGKTRAMIADACFIACDKMFNSKTNEWIDIGVSEPVLFISTEQEIDEIQTMLLAFISDVDEDHIIYNQYGVGEYDRVMEAAEIIERSPLHIKKLPDFALKDIENAIKYSIREWDCRYIFFDYIHSSMKILSEVSSKAGVKGLREDNVLFMISVRLKDLCNQYGVFIMSATQLNADYTTAQQYDQNLLRGAKSIADKIDAGLIMLQTSQEDIESLKDVIQQGGFEIPQIKVSIYKNRRGRYKDILLWCSARRGVCKIEPMFATNYQYELVQIDNLNIKVKPKIDVSAF